MQRKATKQSRGPNKDERAFQAWTKEQPCCTCGDRPVIVDHIWGSSKKLYYGLERVLVGHWAVIPLCMSCDSVKTHGSRRAFRERFGDPVNFWLDLAMKYMENHHIPENVFLVISRNYEL